MKRLDVYEALYNILHFMNDKIFISYSRADFEKVIAIKHEIDSLLSINCWIDLDGIESGNDHFEKVIIEAINRHSIMLFMLSDDSMNSEYAMKELRYAKAKNKHIILIDLGCNNGMTDEFLFNFKGADIIDYENELQNRKLMKDLALLCNRSIDVTTLTWKSKKGNNRLARILYFSLYVIVACICCVLCVDSLWGVVNMNKNLLWIVVISYFILCSVGFSQLSYSIGVRRTTKEIIFKFLGGIGLILIFGIAFLIPCQTHTLYYRFHIEKSVYDDISDIKKHLYTIDNSTSSVLLENIRNIEIDLSQNNLKLFSLKDMSFVDKVITNAYTQTNFFTCEPRLENSYYYAHKQTKISRLLNLFSVWRFQFTKGFNAEFILFIFATLLLNILALWLFDKFSRHCCSKFI